MRRPYHYLFITDTFQLHFLLLDLCSYAKLWFHLFYEVSHDIRFYISCWFIQSSCASKNYEIIQKYVQKTIDPECGCLIQSQVLKKLNIIHVRGPTNNLKVTEVEKLIFHQKISPL
jgi:hypothetical protein